MPSRVYIGVTDGAALVATAEPVANGADPSRLGALFEAHHRRLYRLARRMVATADDARDLVQEAFVRAARAPGAIPVGASAEEAWLVRVLINLCRDRWRRRAIERRFLERQRPADSRAGHANVESAVIAETLIWRALRQLSPRRRAIIVLHELDGTSVADIAAMLGITAVTVRWHLARGRQELGRLIKDDAES